MRLMVGVILSLVLGVSSVVAHQSSTSPVAQAKSEKSGGAPSDVDAMRADVQKMRVILNQMRTNLAFVATSATPLKHQFELEIDMWQIVLDQMDRRVAEMERREGKP
jgi:hypothetical protein